MAQSKTWYMIPVRGGSKGVPRKNARMIAGKPLIAHTLETLLSVDKASQIFVLTDDDELQTIAEIYGVNVHHVDNQSGTETLDDKANELLPVLKKAGAKDQDIFLTIQATCPLVKGDTIKAASNLLAKGEKKSVITAIDDRHLGWHLDKDGMPVPDYEKRVNRQQLPPAFRESGAVIGAKIGDIKAHKTRIIAPIGLLPISKEEGTDIDDFIDWTAAEYLLTHKKIYIRADASSKRGMGHVYRATAVAQELAKYKPVFVTLDIKDYALGAEFFESQPFETLKVKSDEDFVKQMKREKPELIVLDQLDTDASYVKALKKTGAKVVTFEDMGEGAGEADLLISDLYENPNIPTQGQISGVRASILAPSFEIIKPRSQISKTVENILILFGGTDPANLTEKALETLKTLKFKGHVTVVQGLGRKDRTIDLKKYGLKGEVLTNVKYMPGVMRRADLAFSSAGRTITELMTLAVPTICICQNEKELTHTHASQAYGILNLGLGEFVSIDTLAENTRFLIDSYEFRTHMRERAMRSLKGHTNRAVMKMITERLGIDL